MQYDWDTLYVPGRSKNAFNNAAGDRIQVETTSICRAKPIKNIWSLSWLVGKLVMWLVIC